MSNTGYKEITRIGEGFINYNYGELNSEGGNNLFKSYLLGKGNHKSFVSIITQT